ncbi:MAG: NUDIX domain-containing protein [Calditrichaeota bacterium]|nr:NUDIX domain-containing protein [Calditrichota bacterium]MCB9391478.1 NUDIX domain-containing protein [Calditrichota bacterium]
MSELTHRVAAAAYVFRGDRVLLLKRATPPFTFAPPGGRLHPNEDPVYGALREVREETGLDIEILDVAQVWFGKMIAGTTPLLCINFLARSSEGNPVLSDEHTDYVWATRESLRTGETVTQDQDGFGYRAASILDAFDRHARWIATNN